MAVCIFEKIGDLTFVIALVYKEGKKVHISTCNVSCHYSIK